MSFIKIARFNDFQYILMMNLIEKVLRMSCNQKNYGQHFLLIGGVHLEAKKNDRFFLKEILNYNLSTRDNGDCSTIIGSLQNRQPYFGKMSIVIIFYS